MSVIFHLKKQNVNKRNSVSVRNSMPIYNKLGTKNSNQLKEKSTVRLSRKKSLLIRDTNDMNFQKQDENYINQTINQLICQYKNSYDLCINSLIKFPLYRNKEIIYLIKPYLKELIGLMNIVSKEKNEEQSDKLLSQIAMYLQYRKIKKNKFICKYGEKGNTFYIILKGKVVFLVPKIVKCYLNESEYLFHLIKLKINGEIELLKTIMAINRKSYDLGEEFDNFIRDLIEDYEKNHKKNSVYITPKLYKVLKQIITEEKNNIANGENKQKEIFEITDLNEFIERSKVNDMNLNSKDRKKVSILIYEVTNYYEDGQIFGTVALESKNGRRTATAISLDECELGLLTKEQYISFLQSVRQKSLESLFNLISSYHILGSAPKRAFDHKFCHMFKCIRFKRGETIMEEKKLINSVFIFSSGKFSITLNRNILELNELMIKLYKIRGKMLGLSENAIKKQLANNDKDYIMNKKFILPETMKMYEKKNNIIISIVNDKLVIGLIDTVDPETHLPLFNCICASESCTGYEITNNSLNLVNKEYSCVNNMNKISLINIEYYLKRLQLHIKEIETKIDNYNKNLKYDIPIIKTENYNNGKESQKSINESGTLNDGKNLFEIRRNTFEVKKKKNNEKSLVKILSDCIKDDFSNIKRQRINTIDKINTDSTANLNIENKRYENLKTANDETINDNKENNMSFIRKVKKSIRHKQHLLKISQQRSYKYMEIKKAEIRSINMARNIKVQKDKYVDISAIFNKDDSSKEKKNRFGILRKAQKKDIVLENIIHNINKKAKYDRVLSSYLSENRLNDSIKEDEKEETKINKEEKEKKENNEEAKNDNYEIKEIINDSKVEDKQVLSNNRLKTDGNINNNSIVYPIIKSSFHNLVSNHKKDLNDIIKQKNNVITLDGLNSLGDYDLSKNKKPRRKIVRTLDKMIDVNHRNKINYKSIGIKINNNNKKTKKIYSNFPNILSVYNKDDVNFVDPLVLDKFNDRYINSYKKLSKNVSKNKI